MERMVWSVYLVNSIYNKHIYIFTHNKRKRGILIQGSVFEISHTYRVVTLYPIQVNKWQQTVYYDKNKHKQK